jgi:hypothetical protein
VHRAPGDEPPARGARPRTASQRTSRAWAAVQGMPRSSPRSADAASAIPSPTDADQRPSARGWCAPGANASLAGVQRETVEEAFRRRWNDARPPRAPSERFPSPAERLAAP